MSRNYKIVPSRHTKWRWKLNQVMASDKSHLNQSLHIFTARNEVWGKVIFLLACVILLTGGGLCMMSLSVEGVSIQGVSVQRGLCQRDPSTPKQRTPVRWRAGSMHPTGMLSCKLWLYWIWQTYLKPELEPICTQNNKITEIWETSLN